MRVNSDPLVLTDTPALARQVSVVILNWKQPVLTAACVAAVQAAGVPPAAIIVVDNGSGDGSPAELARTLDPAVQLIALDANLGFAGGNNVGIRRALADGVDWVLLLNNDAFVAPDLFVQLAQAAQAYPAPALLSPLIVYDSAPDRIWSIGDKRIAGTLLTRSLYRDQTIPGDLPPVIEADFLSACCLLVRRDVFATIGLLDERYFVYGEDADFCLRATRAGFRLACAPAARVRHAVSASTRHDDARRLALKLTEQIRFYRTYAGPLQRGLLFVFTLLRAGRKGGHRALHVWWRAWRQPLAGAGG